MSIMTDVKCLVGLVFCLININAHHAHTTVSQKMIENDDQILKDYINVRGYDIQ